MHSDLWVFGYGSLCWSPGFEYEERVVGCIKGFKRRFWQGNTVQRGTIKKPGRVVTLIETENSETWGVAFKITGSNALNYLQVRECILGGYITTTTDFHPQDGRDSFQTILYIATTESEHWVGKAPAEEIAVQIAGAEGVNGHNIEYLFQLAEFMRTEVPHIWDNHLFRLENHVLGLLQNPDSQSEDLGESQVSEDRMFAVLEGHSISCAAS